MWIPINDAAMLLEILNKKNITWTVVCLWEPYMNFTWKELKRMCWTIDILTDIDFSTCESEQQVTWRELFSAIGFDRYLSLDISEYEWADIIHDLNIPFENKEYFEIADFIIDSWTLEHVFNVPNALATIYYLLKDNWIVLHHSPANWYIDHWFYQFSPTLFYDYYRENNYKIVSANVINRRKGLSCEPYITDIYRNKYMRYWVKYLQRSTLFFCAQKKHASTFDKIPTQTFYREMHNQNFKQKYENEFPYSYTNKTIKDYIYYTFPNLVKKILTFVWNCKKIVS